MPADSSESLYPRLNFVVDARLVSRFFMLLQQGVSIRRRVGCSVDMFLKEEIGAAPETIEKIQSIILDGKPVDDIVSALVHEGSTLALSAAMPGLVGATLRRGGAYSSFRSAITYHEAGAPAPREGWVRVKIFNLLMADLGPGLLQNGVLVNSHDLIDILSGLSSDLASGDCRIKLDGKAIDIGMISNNTSWMEKENSFLTVEAG